jgi:hypothetical protein
MTCELLELLPFSSNSQAKAELHAGRNFEEVLELYNEACSLMPTV